MCVRYTHEYFWNCLRTVCERRKAKPWRSTVARDMLTLAQVSRAVFQSPPSGSAITVNILGVTSEPATLAAVVVVIVVVLVLVASSSTSYRDCDSSSSSYRDCDSSSSGQ